MRSNITVLLTIFINSILLSTINARMPDTTANIIEEGWIEKMTNKIAVDVSLNNSYSVFEVKTPSNRILLYPNTPNNLRLKFSYDFISFGIQFSPDFIPGNGDNEKKGKTNSFKIGTAAIFKHWFADIVYKKVRGYYLKIQMRLMAGQVEIHIFNFLIFIIQALPCLRDIYIIQNFHFAI
jgi:hypothetical protein